MVSKSTFDRSDLIKILLALVAFGAGWIVNHQATAIAFLSMGIVWLLGWAGKTYPKLEWIKGKAFLTALVYGASFVLSLFIQHLTLAAFPIYSGDASAYVVLLADYVGKFFAALQTQALFAVSIYNVLLADVLAKLGDGLTGLRARFYLR